MTPQPTEPKDGDFVTYLEQIEQRQMRELARQQLGRQNMAHAPQPGKTQARPLAPVTGAHSLPRPQGALVPAPASTAAEPNAGGSVAPSLLSAAIIMLLGMASFLYGAASNGGPGFIAIAAVLIWLGARRLARRTAATASR